MVKDMRTNVSPTSGQSLRNRDRGGGINLADTLRRAAHALSGRTDVAHAPALAGLLHNRADDMERNIVLWRRSAQNVHALAQQHYGVYLAIAEVALFGPRTSPFPQTN
jgi:hypothetical protein